MNNELQDLIQEVLIPTGLFLGMLGIWVVAWFLT